MAFKKFIKFASVFAVCFGGLCLSVVPASTASAAQTPVTCPDGSLWKGHESETDANGKLRITSVAQCNMPYNADASKDPKELTLTVQTIINVIIGVIGVIAVVVVILGGVYYVISQGEAAKIAKAKNTILYGIVGLVIALLAFAIVNFVLKSVFA